TRFSRDWSSDVCSSDLADKEGKFVFKDAVVYGNAGARIYWSPNIIGTACTRPDSLYHFHNVRAKGYLAYTNVSPTTCMRGFGNEIGRASCRERVEVWCG